MKFSAKNELIRLDEYYPNSDLKHIYQIHREKIIVLLNTLELVWKQNKLDEESSQILTEGLKNPWEVVFYFLVGKEINLMTGKIKGIENLILEGIEDKRWQTRFNTIVIMKGFKNKEIRKIVLEKALNDKSVKVREMAMDVKNYW
ncbi:MAG: hypothetical protein IPH88_02895 [Bacteroidales bacterium]|nr:hypothetical protein [Bacteroidales bacterium]